MTANPRTLEYIQRGVEILINRGTFRNGRSFRPTQGDALLAYYKDLNSEDLTPEERLTGFFEIPTGVGKTAVFLASLDEAHKIARTENDKLRVMIVVPTVAILKQMEDEIREWAPDYLDTVGFYGDVHRQIGKELTVIIYNSWVTLMDEGKIDSSNIDILISDEAHRGTSERRLTTKFNSFSAGTVQLAFTATARFDEEKSVEQSHGRQIFSRGIGESVRLGELAAYIQTQLYKIRVQPSIEDELEDSDETPEERTARRTGARQEAWMRQMVAVWRDGRDQHTRDLLTDNKSGIYVFGTRMADRFVELANKDPVLQERAREQGCKRLIVAVHSKMSEDPDAVLESFRRGEILGVVSDGKMKEGFNYPAMKNVFDYPRSSLVDKAQIIGRPARKWWNPIKERLEGATVIDSIIYNGSNDPEEDKWREDNAIRNAVMAWSVLEGTAVFSPKEEFRAKSNNISSGSGFCGVSPVLGLDVSSYIELEDLQAIYAEQRKLQGKNRIEITNEMREELNSLMAQKGVASQALIKAAKIENIKPYFINNWGSGEVISADIDDWNHVIESLRGLPDRIPRDTIQITDKMREELNSLMDKKGFKSYALIKVTNLEIKANAINDWKDGRAKTVNKPDWEKVIAALQLLPDKKIKNIIQITDEMLDVMNALMMQKGVGSQALLSRVNIENIKPTMIESWRSKDAKSADHDMWDKVISALEGLPDTTIFSITADMRNNLNNLMAIKSIGSRALIKTGNLEEGRSAIEGWRTGKIKTTDKKRWDKVIEALESLPDMAPSRTSSDIPKPPSMG